MWSGSGESERVAARVRALVGRVPDDEPAGGQPDRRGPAGRRAVRLDPGRRSALAVGIAVAVAALLTGLWVVSSRPRTMPVDAAAPTIPGATALVAPSSSPSSSAAATPSVSTATEVVVDVAGKVRRPGIYRLPSGSRVDDAIRAAGGALRGVDLSSLNLAAKVIDGQQIPVGRPGAAPMSPAGGGAASAGGASGEPVNLNTAGLDQLETLPGIGPALGQRILDYRTEHGSFGSVDQLDDVAGIGTVTFARLKPLVTV